MFTHVRRRKLVRNQIGIIYVQLWWCQFSSVQVSNFCVGLVLIKSKVGGWLYEGFVVGYYLVVPLISFIRFKGLGVFCLYPAEGAMFVALCYMCILVLHLWVAMHIHIYDYDGLIYFLKWVLVITYLKGHFYLFVSHW